MKPTTIPFCGRISLNRGQFFQKFFSHQGRSWKFHFGIERYFLFEVGTYIDDASSRYCNFMCRTLEITTSLTYFDVTFRCSSVLLSELECSSRVTRWKRLRSVFYLGNIWWVSTYIDYIWRTIQNYNVSAGSFEHWPDWSFGLPRGVIESSCFPPQIF